MNDKLLNNYLPLLKVLADDTRLKILSMLKMNKMTATEILKELDIKQPTLSYHLNLMNEVGLLNTEEHWKWTTYSINKDGVKEINSFFESLAAKKCKVKK